MLWQSLLQGIQLFSHQTLWAGLLPLLLYQILFHSLLFFATQPKVSQDAAAPGCLTQILGTLFHGFFLGCWILWIFPALFGQNTLLAWPDLEKFLWLGIQAGIIGALALHVMSFFPFFGAVIGNSPGMETFLIGATVFRLSALHILPKIFPGQTFTEEIFPQWYEWLFFILVVFICSKILYLIWKNLPGLKNGHSGKLSIAFSTLDQASALVGLLALAALVKSQFNS